MRTILAAVLLTTLGTGCCKTCGWCHDDTPARTGFSAEAPPATPASPATTQPPTPAGVPASRPAGTGAYGGTGN
ncbi:hypothetical protein [Urbifossiella limnaea]|uniref:Uncharacterized protein n=1 Tax=Urbifossiella limnaea TaxID=2528023 RepID=A0A517XXW3_9BACT|nr:hypothetical protein [Urbifossiella limnaea]QDU22326.1 hypothetical protein ETAA1_43040 [Urbifossiella limnaea]